MSDEAKAEDQQKEAFEKAQAELKELSTEKLIEIISDTRKEAKERRLQNRELEERLNALESQKQKEEQDKKLAEGKKDEVIKELTDKLTSLENKSKEFDEYNKTRRTQLKEIIKEDNWLPSYDEIVPLQELEILASKYSVGKVLKDTDNGSGKKSLEGKLEGLKKDLQTAIDRKDLTAQIEIKRMIREEQMRKQNG